jgi:hypothetical protein
MWPELLKAKQNVQEIEDLIDELLKSHSSLTRREIARHGDTLAADFEETLEAIRDRLDEFALHMKNHRRYLHSKARFVRRHYSRRTDERI